MSVQKSGNFLLIENCYKGLYKVQWGSVIRYKKGPAIRYKKGSSIRYNHPLFGKFFQKGPSIRYNGSKQPVPYNGPPCNL